MNCDKCNKLMELFSQTPQNNRNYWLMTELFVMLHGSDECRIGSREELSGLWPKGNIDET